MKINRDARVRARDGELGRVRHVVVDPETHEMTDIVVGDGVREWLIPTDAVESVDGDIRLRGTVSELADGSSHFDRDSYHGVDGSEVRDRGRQSTGAGGARVVDAGEDTVEIAGEETTRTGAAGAGAGDGPYELQLRAEKLRVHKDQQEAGHVRLRREIREHIETVEVPLREERLVIECLPGRGSVIVDGRELTEGNSIELTLKRERVVIDKQLEVSEDVHVRKEQVTRTEPVREPLRAEELTIDDPQGFVGGNRTGTARADAPSSGDARFIARPEARRSHDDRHPEETGARAPAPQSLRAGEGSDMYDPTPEPMEYASVTPDHERLPVMEDSASDGQHDRGSERGERPHMQPVEQNQERARELASTRRARAHPGESGQLNPGSHEYQEQLPDGPAGTGEALDSGIPKPPKRGDAS